MPTALNSKQTIMQFFFFGTVICWYDDSDNDGENQSVIITITYAIAQPCVLVLQLVVSAVDGQ